MDTTNLDTGQIKTWRSILTLIVFVITMLFPFRIPFYVPRILTNAALDALSGLRIIPQRRDGSRQGYVRLHFPMDFLTAPLIADLFLLAVLAIGREEVRDGTVGADHIFPIDIMVFFITLAYIAISIDASGLIRYMAFMVLKKGGNAGKLLYLYLYAFFFGLATLIGNDPIVLSGTPFLAYMTTAASNIDHPKAWLYMQFATANIASAILVSSNPTNLVLAGAFQIKFIVYTANMIVPVIATAIVLFPFMLYVLYRKESLIPSAIKMHELPDEVKAKSPVNPNIPYSRGAAEDDENEMEATSDQAKRLLLEEIMNPFLDKRSATFGACIMAATLITILVVNAVSQDGGQTPAFYVTLPAAVIMFCWDVTFGWIRRAETRKIARDGRRQLEEARANRETAAKNNEKTSTAGVSERPIPLQSESTVEKPAEAPIASGNDEISVPPETLKNSGAIRSVSEGHSNDKVEKQEDMTVAEPERPDLDVRERSTLQSVLQYRWQWSRETFPTTTAVLAHLPIKLVPFALCMFVLVQGLVTKGWVPVFAYGWDDWIKRTGSVGAIGGMAFLSIVLCNFAGTNIGTTILLCRVVQAWIEIHRRNGIPITQRTFWATVYSMAIGLNYGAFSTAFSASLAGMLWRDILARKHIHVRAIDFARENLSIITLTTVVGCAVLIGEVYITRNQTPYNLDQS